MFRQRDFVPFASDLLLLLLSTILISLASETITLELTGACEGGRVSRNCFLTLATATLPARAAEGVLGAMLVLVLFIGVSLFRWQSGVATHPGSLASVCALMQDEEVVKVMREVRVDVGGGDGDKQLKGQLEGYLFTIGWEERGGEYRILLLRGGSNDAASETGSTARLVRSPPGCPPRPNTPWKAHLPSPTPVLRTLALLSHTSLLTLLLYYELKVFRRPSDSPFESSMDSQRFGPRFLFATLGSLSSFFWDDLFSTVAAQDTYRRMMDRPQAAATSVLAVHSVNVFEGLWLAVCGRNLRVGAVAGWYDTC